MTERTSSDHLITFLVRVKRFDEERYFYLISIWTNRNVNSIIKLSLGDVITGAQSIMDTLITRQSKLMYPRVHCYLARVQSFFA